MSSSKGEGVIAKYNIIMPLIVIKSNLDLRHNLCIVVIPWLSNGITTYIIKNFKNNENLNNIVRI
ncbi:hypothetical protein RTB9991CWPP_00915 [Rickettsia typhi str. B9991CWPP]|uniref:Uncharacterized protein n=1 Tax=Rickettsia typhi str. TH1527 TaxID=1003201 RepID=A0ABM5MV37_RICTP|nr:hypothetical protein RTTH1527_00910 [Rickettsia typhi str. TH1527]AFE54886.1 hypothetical protein RTB9991CWPP_00915 [Rickettsia typhi str. B9991CWPP]